MADSPEKNSEGVIKLSILSEGKALEDTVKIVSVHVVKAANSIPFARIVLMDGDMPDKDFPVSNGKTLKPGVKITINAGYKDSEDTIFVGTVTKHSLKITGDNYSRLIIECRDKAVAMTVGRKNANYVDSKDNEIITKIIGNYAGLTASVDSTKAKHPEIVQYYSTDWDFILSRADASGLLVMVNDSKVNVSSPDVTGSPVLTVTYGQDLMEFHADMEARSQFSEVKGLRWDPGSQKVVAKVAAPKALNKQGNIDSKELAKVVNLKSFRLQTPVMMEDTALQQWADSQQLKSGLSRLRGRMKFQGSSKAVPGVLIELAGVGDRFSGNVFVSAVNHEIADGNWTTEVEFGLSPDWFSERRDLVAPPASGLLPGVEGLHIGVVMKLDGDPEKQNRVQVSVPLLEAETEGVWARLSCMYASNEFGEFFIPEVGDEVILGYLNNDPAHPVILGSLYSAKNPPPYKLTEENNIKAFVTRSKIKIEFDDDKKVLTATTPNNNKIVFSDDDKSILVQDETNNKIEMSQSGIALDSPKDITINAKGKISLSAAGAISLKSDSDVTAKGLNIQCSADVGMTAKGGATAELSASGNTTVKGAMVMIN